MYDNVDLALHRDLCPRVNFLQMVPNLLTTVTNQGSNNYGEYVLGYLDSLKVKITENKVKIYDSSLCKYYLGNNFKTLSKGDTMRTIEKISNSLHLPFDMAIVNRIDFATNLIMKYDEKAYYPYLGEARYYNRLEQNNGLYFNNQKRQLVFYGKEHEQKVKGQPIPELYKDRHTLRYEMRFRKDLRQQLKQPIINGQLLYKEMFYNSVVTRWKDEYLAIQKINSKLSNMKPTGSKRVLAENLALYTILDIGQSNVLNNIKEWQLVGHISKKQAYDLRAFIKEISKTTFKDQGNELINELTKKIKEAARY
ncbi:MAG TPA: phage/plasmid replication protein [Saprospiraceae bacterium]|nr:phage/plasmid replication protein [Saprospiraceae bacterium]